MPPPEKSKEPLETIDPHSVGFIGPQVSPNRQFVRDVYADWSGALVVDFTEKLTTDLAIEKRIMEILAQENVRGSERARKIVSELSEKAINAIAGTLDQANNAHKNEETSTAAIFQTDEKPRAKIFRPAPERDHSGDGYFTLVLEDDNVPDPVNTGTL